MKNEKEKKRGKEVEENEHVKGPCIPSPNSYPLFFFHF